MSREGSCPSGQCCETQSCHHDSITDVHVSGRGRDVMPSCLLLLWTSSVMGLGSRVPSNPPLRVPKGLRCLSFLGCFSGLLLLSVRKGHGASHWSPYSSTQENTSLSRLGLDTRPIAPCVRLLRTPPRELLGPWDHGGSWGGYCFCQALVMLFHQGEAISAAGCWRVSDHRQLTKLLRWKLFLKGSVRLFC